MKEEVRFSVGTQFNSGGKHPVLCTVEDIFRTYNMDGELVKVEYAATYKRGGIPGHGLYPVTSVAKGFVYGECEKVGDPGFEDFSRNVGDGFDDIRALIAGDDAAIQRELKLIAGK